MTLPLIMLCLCAGAALGVGLMTALAVARNADDADDTAACRAAWYYICRGLAAKGWRRVTPELVVALAPSITSDPTDPADALSGGAGFPRLR